jgi:SLT domain-containing protein
MAAGGIVTSPTLALIGEAGPEAVIPLGTGGGGIGGADMVHVQLVIDGQVLIDAVRKAVRNRGGSVQGVLG